MSQIKNIGGNVSQVRGDSENPIVHAPDAFKPKAAGTKIALPDCPKRNDEWFNLNWGIINTNFSGGCKPNNTSQGTREYRPSYTADTNDWPMDTRDPSVKNLKSGPLALSDWLLLIKPDSRSNPKFLPGGDGTRNKLVMALNALKDIGVPLTGLKSFQERLNITNNPEALRGPVLKWFTETLVEVAKNPKTGPLLHAKTQGVNFGNGKLAQAYTNLVASGKAPNKRTLPKG